MRERREQIERLSRRRCIHLSFEGADEAFPFSFRHRRFALRHQFRAGSKVGVPHIEPIVARITFLPDATRRIPHRADPSPFFWMTRFTQAHDPQCHDAPIAVRPAEGRLSVFRPTGPMWANGYGLNHFGNARVNVLAPQSPAPFSGPRGSSHRLATRQPERPAVPSRIPAQESQ